MANPLQRIIELAKSGDKRVLFGGAVVIGGGVGLIVFLRKRNQPGGASGNPTDANSPLPVEQGNGLLGDSGGGGGGGGDATGTSDTSGLDSTSFGGSGDLGSSLPTLSDLPPLPGGDPFGVLASPQPLPAEPVGQISPFEPISLPSLSPIGSSGGMTPTDFGNSFASPAMVAGGDPYGYNASPVEQYSGGGTSPYDTAKTVPSQNVPVVENVTAHNSVIARPENNAARAERLPPAEPVGIHQGVQTGPAEPVGIHQGVQTSPAEPVGIHQAITSQPAEPIARNQAPTRTAQNMVDQLALNQRLATDLMSQAQAQANAAHQAALEQAQRQAEAVRSQQLAAYENLRQQLLAQQSRGNYGATVVGRNVSESNSYGISGAHVPMPTPAQARVVYSPAPALARNETQAAPAAARISAAPAMARSQENNAARSSGGGRTQG